MNWEKWVLISVIALSTLMTIGMVGRPRETMTPGNAIFITLGNAAFIWLVVLA